MKINEKEQKYIKDEIDVKEQADFKKISTMKCSYDPIKYILEFSIDGTLVFCINDFKILGFSPFLIISKNYELETDFSYL